MAGETDSSSYVDLSVAYVDATVTAADYLVVLPVAGPLIMSALALMMRRQPHLQPWIAGITLGVVFIGNLALTARVLDTGPVFMAMGRWLPPFGISFNADALSVIMVLTSSLGGAGQRALFSQKRGWRRATLWILPVPFDADLRCFRRFSDC
jgi:multicomponent Na+:H+ antiporter subunit D